uniref:hypothetical protein n=1 Tax=Pontiella sp. TaxID=2837462 RepID=UPI0035671DC6
MQKMKNCLWGMSLLISAVAVQAAPVSDSGTYFVSNGKPQVNESLIRSGRNNNGQIEFVGYAIYDLSGIAGKAAEGGISLTGNVKAFKGKPAGLTVEFLGTYGEGDLNLTSGAQWAAAEAVVSQPVTPKGTRFTVQMGLPADE